MSNPAPRGRGRPPCLNPRDRKLLLAFTRAEHKALCMNAKRIGMNRSEAIRDAMRAYGLLPRV